MKVIHKQQSLGKQAANKEKNVIKRCEEFPGNLLLQWTAQLSLNVDHVSSQHSTFDIDARWRTLVTRYQVIPGYWLPGSLDLFPRNLESPLPVRSVESED